LPGKLAGLHDYDLIILDNVAADQLSRQQMTSLRAYVHDLGGGFVMVGGDQSFGAGGYYRTPVEDLLPVSLDVRNKKHLPSLALVLVIDKSGSMAEQQLGRSKIELAAEAASAAVDTLSERDSAGVIAFDDQARPVFQLARAEDKKAVHRAIQGVAAGGGTAIHPGLKMAYDWLGASDAQLKHVILLSDGESQPGNFRQIARSMSDAGITLSSVAVGESADFALMKLLADIGGGRYYEAGDPQSLAAIFSREAFLASGAAIVEEPFVPLLKAPSQATAGIDWAGAPRLLGYSGTAERQPQVEGAQPPAVTALVSHRDDPVYAVWQYGLGRAAAFTPDLKPRWAAGWMNWAGFGQFVTQMLRDVVRRGSGPGEFSVEPRITFEQTRDGAHRGQISVEALTADGRFKNDLRLRARVVAPDLGASEVDLEQTASGRYEAVFPAPARGAYLINLFQQGGEALAVTGSVKSYSPEFAVAAAETGTLARIAGATGGSIIDDSLAVSGRGTESDLFGRRVPKSSPREIWQSLLVIALVLLPIDVGLRRVHITADDAAGAVAAVREKLVAFGDSITGRSRAPAEAEAVEDIGRLKASRGRLRLREAPARLQDGRVTGDRAVGASKSVTAPAVEQQGAASITGRLGEPGPESEESLAGKLLEAKKKRE
jgi:Mg-chelatase subunit ChlD